MSSSIRDIARQSGFSTATVSLALRGKGRISRETREIVQKAAKALDYHPNPLFSKSCSLARRPNSPRYRETLAFLIEWDIATGPEHQREIFAGASEQASKMGYKLDTFFISGIPAAQRRLGRVLHSRGIRGLIVPPILASRNPRLHFDWKCFAAVEIERTVSFPRNLHRVEAAEYPAIIEALHLLKKVGFRRIGMAIEPMQNRNTNGVPYAAYLVSQLKVPTSRQIPILAQTGEWNEESFRSWMKQHNPDVIFIHGVVAATIQQWLANMALRVPDDVSIFCSNILQNDELAGLRRDYAAMGQAAVEMASLLLEGNELGLSENPRCSQVAESWQCGSTLKHPIGDYITQAGFLCQDVRLRKHILQENAITAQPHA